MDILVVNIDRYQRYHLSISRKITEKKARPGDGLSRFFFLKERGWRENKRQATSYD